MTTTTLTPAEILATDPTVTDRADKPSRTIKYRWTVGTLPSGSTVQVQLHVSHYGSSKSFSATVNRLIARGDGSELYAPFDQVRIGTTPCARFSATRLRSYAASVRARLEVETRSGAASELWPGLLRHFRPAGEDEIED